MTYQLKGNPTKKEQWGLAGANPKIIKQMVWKQQLKEGHQPSNNFDDYQEVQVWTGDYIITSTKQGDVFKNGTRSFTRNVIVKANKVEEVITMDQDQVDEINKKIEIQTGSKSIWDLELKDGKVWIQAQQGDENIEFLTIQRLKDEVDYLKELADENKDDDNLKSYKDCLIIRDIYKELLNTMEVA